MGKVLHQLFSIAREKRAGFFVLIDPDKVPLDRAARICSGIEAAGGDAILVGGSLLFTTQFDDFIRTLKQNCSLPVIIFPGNSRQISRFADAILFLSFISSRNPTYLIGEQVIAAPIIKSLNLEAIATGYMHIESGNVTTVEFFSGARSIPRDKTEIAVAHALAAEYLGMKLVYLEAGSGARYSIPDAMIRGVSSQISIPVIVGGGIRSPEEARAKVEAGAQFVVVGNFFESDPDFGKMREFASAIHDEGVQDD